MRISFYSPFKKMDHPVPSGDREIARSLFAFFNQRGDEARVLTRFESFLFFQDAIRLLLLLPTLIFAIGRSLIFRPTIFFTYHHYYRAPDLIHPILAFLFRKPYFIFEGMYSVRSREKVPYWVWWWTRFALQSSTHVFSDKPDDISGLRAILPEARITYIPPALDTDFFKPDPKIKKQFRRGTKISDDQLVVLCVAMLRADRKSEGVKFLIEALAGKPFKDITFILIGGGPMEDEIQKLAKEKLGARTIMAGQQDKSWIRDAMCASDVFAFPGIDEGIGLVYLEAQACGLPCVAFDNAGTPSSIARDQTGFLTPLGDLTAYRNALQTLLENSELRREMGGTARRRILEEFDQKKVYAKMHSIIAGTV